MPGRVLLDLTLPADWLLPGVVPAQEARYRVPPETEALPNGYCGLPVQKACPHANACVTCPMFLTTAAHVPAHREHRIRGIELITRAQAEGRPASCR